MNENIVKNSFVLVLIGLIMIGNVLAYAADKEAVRSESSSLAAFEIFLQKKRDEIAVKAQRDNPDGKMFLHEEVALNEIKKLIGFVNRVKLKETGVLQNERLNPKITDYMTAKLFVVDETIRTTFIEIFNELLFFRISFPTELIEILSAIAADQALSKEQLNYLSGNFISFEYESLYVGGDAIDHGIHRKSRVGTSGYGESLRRTSIRALKAIGRHQELPFETLLILVKGMTDPLENGYVTEASYEALKTIGSDYSLFSSSEVTERFESLFIADINYWMDSDEITDTAYKVRYVQAQWRLQANAADLFASVAKNKKIPSKLLNQMNNILFYQLDETKLKKIADLDYERSMSFIMNDNFSSLVRQRVLDYWNRKRNEALESSRERLNELRVSVASSFGEIGKYQALSDEMIEKMEILSSSETEHPDVRRALQEALTSISEEKESLKENPIGSICESSMRNPEERT